MIDLYRSGITARQVAEKYGISSYAASSGYSANMGYAVNTAYLLHRAHHTRNHDLF